MREKEMYSRTWFCPSRIDWIIRSLWFANCYDLGSDRLLEERDYFTALAHGTLSVLSTNVYWFIIKPKRLLLKDRSVLDQTTKLGPTSY